jgi:alpha-L-arabinofuranosidase
MVTNLKKRHRIPASLYSGFKCGLSRRSMILGTAAAALNTVLGACTGASPKNKIEVSEMPGTDMKIMIDANNVSGNFLRPILGEGLIFGYSYMWDEKRQRMWPDLMERIKELNSDFFGHFGGPGVWVHDYHWKDCIGPMNKRKDPTPRFHNFDGMNGLCGTHEYGLMLKQYRNTTNREILGSIQVNIMTGTAEEAADWVEYMNGSPRTKWGSVRSDNDHREPFNVQYWELGNQPHFTYANVGRLTGTEYSKRVREFTKAMKQRDPNIKVTAYLPFFAFDGTVEEALKLGSAIPDVPGEPGSNGPTWTQLVLKEAGDIIDALDFHWYGSVNTRAHEYEYIMSSAYKGLLPNIERAKQMVQQDAPSNEARERLSKFVCPEYGAISSNGPLAETCTAVYGAVANSRLLHLFVGRDDLLYAARFGLFAPYPQPRVIRDPRPSYVALYGRTDGSDFMGTAIYEMKRLWGKAYQPKIVVAQTENIPSFSTGVSVLDVTAMKSDEGKNLNLVLTNAAQQGLRSKIELSDFKPRQMAKRLKVSGELTDDNRWETRSNVVLETEEIQISESFDIELPPHSVTAVLIKSA